MGLEAGVIGASGYAGGELLRLLAGHPSLDVVWAAAAGAAGEPVAARHPALGARYAGVSFCALDEGLEQGADVVFLALPHGEAAAVIHEVGSSAGVIIDLSADFRLRTPSTWAAWYGSEHPAPAELGSWPYGLPELWRAGIAGATRVAVPGCYPTAALLALGPLVRGGLIETAGIVVDAKSGLSGAGRSLHDQYLFASANEDVSPYGLAGHRHTPEIEQQLSELAGGGVRITFVPHLVPMTRGLLTTCYAQASPDVDGAAFDRCYTEAYGGEPFVDVLPAGAHLHTRALTGTNRAVVALTLAPGDRVIAMAAIDNLGKGAAGQAVQCANIALGLPETSGLDLVATP